MKKFISMAMIAALALCAVSCDKDDDTGNSGTKYRGEKYVGTMSVNSVDQTNIVFYADEDVESGTIDLLMPGVSFMPDFMPYLEMVILDIAKTSSLPDTYELTQSMMYNIDDNTQIINSILNEIKDIRISRLGTSISVSFTCNITTTSGSGFSGDVPVTYEGVSTTSVTEKGLYVEKADSYTSTLMSGVSLTYYKGDGALVFSNFKYATSMPTFTLPITGATVSGDTSFDASELTSYYTVYGMGTSSKIEDLSGVISNSEILLSFNIWAAISGDPSEYYCTYYGDITIEEGSYEGMYMTATDGTPSLLSNVTVTYYEGNDALVITRFAYSAGMQYGMTYTLPIVGVTKGSTSGTATTFSGDGISVVCDAVTDTIDNLSGTIISESKAQFTFTTYVSSYYTTYTCSYIGDITVVSGSYPTE